MRTRQFCNTGWQALLSGAYVHVWRAELHEHPRMSYSHSARLDAVITEVTPVLRGLRHLHHRNRRNGESAT